MKILVVQTAFLGDLVLSTAVFDALIELFPEAEFHLLTTHAGAELFSKDHRFAQVVPFDKRSGFLGAPGFLKTRQIIRAECYDRVYSLHRSLRTSLLLGSTGIKHRIGFQDAHGSCLYTQRLSRERPEHAVTRFLALLSEDWQKQGKDLEALYDRPLTLQPSIECSDELASAIVLVPGSAWKTKQWHWTKYGQVAHELVGQGRKVLLAGNSSEHALCEKIRANSALIQNVAGELSCFQSLFQL